MEDPDVTSIRQRLSIPTRSMITIQRQDRRGSGSSEGKASPAPFLAKELEVLSKITRKKDDRTLSGNDRTAGPEAAAEKPNGEDQRAHQRDSYLLRTPR